MTPTTETLRPCPHDLAERESACADGMCPICLAARPAIDVQKCAEEIAQAIGLGLRNEYQGDVDDIAEVLRRYMEGRA